MRYRRKRRIEKLESICLKILNSTIEFFWIFTFFLLFTKPKWFFKTISASSTPCESIFGPRYGCHQIHIHRIIVSISLATPETEKLPKQGGRDFTRNVHFNRNTLSQAEIAHARKFAATWGRGSRGRRKKMREKAKPCRYCGGQGNNFFFSKRAG